MRVMHITGEWGVQNLKLAEYPDPEIGHGDILIGIEAVSVNPRDRIMVEGGYGSMGGNLPLIPLCDGAGKILAKGSQVSEFSIGDLVIPAFSRTWLQGTVGQDSFLGAHGGPLDGTAQERFAIPASAVVRAPNHLTAIESATLPCAALTAWNALVEQGRISAGQLVVLQGTGGVSIFALQFAKLSGAEVIILSSSDEKLEQAKSLGANHTINYKKIPEWSKSVREISNGVGADQILEVGGAETMDQSVRAVKSSGVISLIGVLGGAEASINLSRIVTRHVRLQGITVGSREMLTKMVRAMELHGVKPVIDDAHYEFEQLGEALIALENGRHFGKIVCSLRNKEASTGRKSN